MAAHRKHPPANALAEIERLAAQGYAQIGIAKHLNVSRSTLKKWMEEDESLQEAFEIGRETERRELHSLLVQSAVQGKPANANAMFLLKCRHNYREFDSPHTKVDVAVAVSPVMVVKDHGTDEEWAAKVAEQQRKLTQGDAQASFPRLPAPLSASHETDEPVSYTQPVPARISPSAPIYAPSWRGRG